MNTKIQNNPNNYIGIFNMDLQRKSKETNLSMKYYYPKLYYADYNSVVYRTNIVNLEEGNIYRYMDTNQELARIYYLALGRERYGMYKVNRDAQAFFEKYK